MCSGGGGNLRLVSDLIDRGALPDHFISGVVADRHCQALEWARSRGFPAHLVKYNRENPGSLHKLLAELEPKLIVTTIHKILDDELLDCYQERLINLHYSLLPAFPGAIGMEPIRLALARGCRLVGATAHRVTAELDGGPILTQASVSVSAQMGERALHDAVFRCGGVALAAALEILGAPQELGSGGLVKTGEIDVFAGPVPAHEVCEVFRAPAFWEGLR